MSITLRSVLSSAVPAGISRRADGSKARWAAASLLAGSVALILASGAGASAAPLTFAGSRPRGSVTVGHQSAVPSIGISVTDGQVAARPGERLAYRVNIQNSGTVGISMLAITLTLPHEMRLVLVSHGGTPSAGKVTWHAPLPAGHTVSVRASAKLTRAPSGLTRLAVVACAVAKGGRPAVCAADLDRLPAVAATASRSGRAARSGGSAAGRSAGYVLAVIAAVVTGALLMLARRRLRPRGRPPRSA